MGGGRQQEVRTYVRVHGTVILVGVIFLSSNKMGCPMMNKQEAASQLSSEYPYESIYRPWSWVLSSLSNLLIFAALVGIAYYYFRTRKSRKQRCTVTYRTANVQTVPSGKIKALVIGGNGRLGREILKTLISDGNYSIYSLDLLLPEEEDRNEGVSTYIQTDITNFEDLYLACKDMDVVFHCASLTPVNIRHSEDDYYKVNVFGTKNVIKACVEQGVKRLIYTSTACVTLSKNSKQGSIDCDEMCPIPSDPLNVYVATKGEADVLVRAANSKDGLLTCVLRPGGFIHTIYSAVEKNLYCIDGGKFELSLVPVESTAEAHLLAEKKLLEDGKESVVAGKAYNITDQKATMDEIIKFLASEKKDSTKLFPVSLVRFLATINEIIFKFTGLVIFDESLTTMNVNLKTSTYVGDLARQELGWGPSPSWRDAMRALIKKNAEEDKKEK